MDEKKSKSGRAASTGHSILRFDGEHSGDHALLLWNPNAREALPFSPRYAPMQAPPADSQALQRWEGEGGQG